jgi:hypothetical protein
VIPARMAIDAAEMKSILEGVVLPTTHVRAAYHAA